jgi:hypothetical protein
MNIAEHNLFATKPIPVHIETPRLIENILMFRREPKAIFELLNALSIKCLDEHYRHENGVGEVLHTTSELLTDIAGNLKREIENEEEPCEANAITCPCEMHQDARDWYRKK